jgi:hypothetical protein
VSYRSREKKKKRLDLLAGVLLAFLGIVVLIALAGGTWWLQSKHVEIDEATNCPKDGPRAVYALLFDQTDPITEQQGEQIKQYVNRSSDSAVTGQRFDLYTVEGDTQRLLTPVLQICSPGNGKKANPIYENPEMIERKFQTRFKDVLQRTVDQLLEVSSKPYSPIIESMKAAAIESFGPYQQTKIPLGLTIISDMIQNTPLNNHFRAVPNFKELGRSSSWRSLQPDLRGANVEILYLLRPSAVRGGVPIQNRSHQLFWEDLIRASNGHIISIQSI